MFPLGLEKLTPEQRAMVDLWERHLRAEFEDKDARASCDTMVAYPYVNHVPVLTGGVGRPAAGALLRPLLHPGHASRRGAGAHLADRWLRPHRG